MEFITILRELWRRRSLVALGALLAIAIGLATAYRVSATPPKLESRQYHVGVASARMLIDTPESQVVDLNPKGADSLGARANLLANLMASSPVKAIIAEHAGLRPEQLVSIAPSMTDGSAVPTLLSQRAAQSANNPEAYVLTIRTSDLLPIIDIEAQAPNAEQAARLADSATTGLRDYLKSTAAAQNVPNARQVVVSTLGAAQSADVVRGPRRLFALIAMVFTFLFVCAIVVVVSGIARGWHLAAELERKQSDRDDDDSPSFRAVERLPEASEQAGAKMQVRPRAAGTVRGRALEREA